MRAKPCRTSERYDLSRNACIDSSVRGATTELSRSKSDLSASRSVIAPGIAGARTSAVRCFLSVPLFSSGDAPEQMFWASASRRVACQRDERGWRQGVLPKTRGMVSGHFALLADAWGLPPHQGACIPVARRP
jgi:hypothetical protein